LGTLKSEQGNPIDLELEITRSLFEDLIAPEVARSMEIVRTAIKNAGESITPDEIDHVLLVGESTYIPLVRSSLAAIFGREKILANVDPMKCVAYGAAILSAKWSERVECPRGHINPGKNTLCEFPGCGELLSANDGPIIEPGVTGMPYGVSGPHGEFEILIPQGSIFPTLEPVKKRFAMSAANLKRLRVPIYAGFDPVASKNELQATVWLELPDLVPVDTPVEVAFSLDEDGIFKKVLAELKDGSGTRVDTYLDRGEGLRSRLEKKLDELKCRRDAMHDDLDAEADKQWEELYSHATKALSANDTGTAGHCAEKWNRSCKADTRNRM
jgi:molecular chaperone DnaK (HSP70)